MTVPLAWALASVDLPLYAAITIAVTLIGVWAAAVADASWGTHDSGRIVIDEVAGYLVTMALVDRHDAWTLGIGFVVFRAFDMIKPPPVRMIDDRMPGGWGVVLDDVAAGVMGAAVMWALAHYGALAALPR